MAERAILECAAGCDAVRSAFRGEVARGRIPDCLIVGRCRMHAVALGRQP